MTPAPKPKKEVKTTQIKSRLMGLTSSRLKDKPKKVQPAVQRKKTLQRLEKDCFKYIQIIALLRDPFCIFCGRKAQAGHHVWGRGLSVAFEPECVRGVCNDCHRFAHANRNAFLKWFYEIVGAWKYEELQQLSRQIVTAMDFEAKRDELKEIITKLERGEK